MTARTSIWSELCASSENTVNPKIIHHGCCPTFILLSMYIYEVPIQICCQQRHGVAQSQFYSDCSASSLMEWFPIHLVYSYYTGLPSLVHQRTNFWLKSTPNLPRLRYGIVVPNGIPPSPSPSSSPKYYLYNPYCPCLGTLSPVKILYHTNTKSNPLSSRSPFTERCTRPDSYTRKLTLSRTT